MKIYVATLFVATLALPGSALGQSTCDMVKRGVFPPQKKTVALASKSGGTEADQFVLFRSKLRVNTDGAPNSYHPNDLSGSSKAINNIANGVSIRKNGKKLGFKGTLRVFGDFVRNDWTPPKGYEITWTNVLAARKENGREIPCVFRDGEYKGYFGSLTALKNGLSAANAGECEVKNQLDERFIPALVIAGGHNPLKTFNVKKGDLLVVLNPGNGVVKAAVVGDSGPTDNLGEGSVALNMALLQKDRQPTNYGEAEELDTGSHQMIVAIIPGSAAYKLERPYSAENIEKRFATWLSEHGYGSVSDFAGLIKTCAGRT